MKHCQGKNKKCPKKPTYINKSIKCAFCRGHLNEKFNNDLVFRDLLREFDMPTFFELSRMLNIFLVEIDYDEYIEDDAKLHNLRVCLDYLEKTSKKTTDQIMIKEYNTIVNEVNEQIEKLRGKLIYNDVINDFNKLVEKIDDEIETIISIPLSCQKNIAQLRKTSLNTS